MGCYDTVVANCPACGTPVDFQTKVGDCKLERFTYKSVPPHIAKGVDGQTERCRHCGRHVTLHCPALSKVMMEVE